LKCIVCYGVGAELADPGGDSSRLRLPKVKRGLGGRRDIASRALVPRSDLCPSKLPLHFLNITGSKTLPSPIGSFAWQDIQDVSCQIFSDLYIGATLVLVWAGVVFSDRSGFRAIRVFGSGGLVRFVSGFKPGLRVRLCHERCRFDGVERWRAPLALFHRQRPPGLPGPAARSTQEQRCFCERDDFASTWSMRRSTSGQLQKTVLNPVDSGRMRA
jgi:hypothetical protein